MSRVLRMGYKIKYVVISFFLLLAVFLMMRHLSAVSLVVPESELFVHSQQDTTAAPWVRIGDTKIFVEVATTSTVVQKGLSGRTSLARNHGMLFLFPLVDRYRFWMPDMHFPLDIIWIADGKVAGVTRSASPKFDPARPVFYTPETPVRHVLEVNAGFAREHGIAVGDAVFFNGIP